MTALIVFLFTLQVAIKFAMHKCLCCGFLTLTEQPLGAFEICPVCYWEDDNVQAANPDYEGGANTVSLNQARQNFIEFGAATREAVKRVRPPLRKEIPQTA
jgi:hypothetical protein